MEIKKYITCIVSILLCWHILSAQKLSFENIERQMEAARERVDSLNITIQELRSRYEQEPSSRNDIARKLSILEPEQFKAIQELDRISGIMAKYEIRNGNHSTENTTATKSNSATLSSALEGILKTAEMENYRSAIRAGKIADVQIGEQKKRYEQLKALINTYESCNSEDEAQVVMKQYEQLCSEVASSEEAIAALWSPVFDNKTYIYYLAMERKGDTSVLDRIDSVISNAEAKRQSSVGKYFSDALVTYHIQKSAILECESILADGFKLLLVRDSLLSESKKTKGLARSMNKLSLPIKSFIEYEEAKQVHPSLYSSSSKIPEVKVYNSGVIYRIRLGCFTTRPSINVFRYFAPLSHSTTTHPQKWSCYAGGYRTEQEAIEAAEGMKRAGFRKPIVSVWADGEYYSDLESYNSSEKYSLEIKGVDEISEQMLNQIHKYSADASISKVSDRFVINYFRPLSMVQMAEAAIHSLDSRIETEIKKVSAQMP